MWQSIPSRRIPSVFTSVRHERDMTGLIALFCSTLQVAQRYNSKRRTVDPTYMTTTQAMMAGQTITQTDLAAIPSDTSKMGSRVMGGSLEILPHARRTGNLALYETSSMAQSAQVYGDRALS
uniref:Uncharacterized protein n=1 Tax=Chrysotila carterae TaxID=13221 RepID=A0A7S4EXL2_CHRCT